MALRKVIRRKSGAKRPGPGKVQVSLHDEDVFATLLQLQETVNELITRLNAHTHTALNTAIVAGQQVQGTVVADTGLFTPAATT